MRWYPATSCLGSCGKSTATMETHFDGVWMGPRRIGCDGGWHLVGGECVPAGRRETCANVGIGGAHLLALPLLSHGLLMPLDGILAILSLEDILLIVELLHKILRSFEILGGLPCVLLLSEALPSDEVLLAHPPTCSSMHEVDLPFIANRVINVRFSGASDPARHVCVRMSQTRAGSPKEEGSEEDRWSSVNQADETIVMLLTGGRRCAGVL